LKLAHLQSNNMNTAELLEEAQKLSNSDRTALALVIASTCHNVQDRQINVWCSQAKGLFNKYIELGKKSRMI